MRPSEYLLSLRDSLDQNDSRCDGPRKIRLSWSQLQNMEHCRQKAKLMRRGAKSPATNIRPFFHGMVVDQVQRTWLSSSDPRPGEMASMVPEWTERVRIEAAESGDGIVRWRSVEDRRSMERYCVELVTRLEPMLQRWVLPYDYEPEHRFRVPLRIPFLDGQPAEIELVGGIDILVREFKDPPVWYMYDLKATSNADYLRKTLGQAVFYDLAGLAGFGVSPRGFTFLQPQVESNPVANVEISDSDRTDMLSRITRAAHGRWRGDDAPKQDSDGCAFCQVRHACSKFSSAASAFAPVRR